MGESCKDAAFVEKKISFPSFRHKVLSEWKSQGPTFRIATRIAANIPDIATNIQEVSPEGNAAQALLINWWLNCCPQGGVRDVWPSHTRSDYAAKCGVRGVAPVVFVPSSIFHSVVLLATAAQGSFLFLILATVMKSNSANVVQTQSPVCVCVCVCVCVRVCVCVV